MIRQFIYAASLACGWTLCAHASVYYTATQREPSIPRGLQIQPVRSIANNGAAVGEVVTQDPSRPGYLAYNPHVYWSSVHDAHILQPLDTVNYNIIDTTTASAINNVGGSCGYGYTNNFSGFARALYWKTHSSAPVAYKPLAHGNSTSGFASCSALTDNGVLVGASTAASGNYHATMWFGESTIDLGRLPGETNSGASSVSPTSSFIAGTSGDHAVLWSYSVIQDLGTLGGTYSGAYGVNDSAQVVGEADTTTPLEEGFYVSHAFLWQSGHMTDLGPADSFGSEATGINRWGDIVGDAYVPAAANDPVGTHGMFWAKGSTVPVDVNQLLHGIVPGNVRLNYAGAIADSGRFEVSGYNNSSNDQVSYLITPHYSTTITLTSSEAPSFYTDKVTFRVNVRTDDAHGTPTGSVIFNDGPTTIKSVKLDSNGNAACSTSSLTVGTHTIYVLYADNDVYAGGVAQISQRVLLKLLPAPPRTAGRQQ